MNIAFLFFGQFRWSEVMKISFLRNFLPGLQNHNIYAFAHFWEPDPNNAPHLEKFKALFPSNFITLEPQKSLIDIHKFYDMKKNLHIHMMSQTYSFHRTFSIFQEFKTQNNIKFDLYIKLRTDLGFIDKITIDNFDSESIYIKNTQSWRPVSNYVNDYIFFTKNFGNVEKISNIGFNFDSILENSNSFLYTGGPDNKLYCCEEILAKYLANQNIKIKFYDYNIDLAHYAKDKI